jgi:hypothetical protein
MATTQFLHPSNIIYTCSHCLGKTQVMNNTLSQEIGPLKELMKFVKDKGFSSIDVYRLPGKDSKLSVRWLTEAQMVQVFVRGVLSTQKIKDAVIAMCNAKCGSF